MEWTKEIIGKVQKAAAIIIAKQTEPRQCGSDDYLYVAELHTISAIKGEPGINVTLLAGRMGISKSRVSQLLTKLIKRDYVYKYKEPSNRKEVLLALTPKGEAVHEAHEKREERALVELRGFLNRVKESEQETISELFTRIIDSLEEL